MYEYVTVWSIYWFIYFCIMCTFHLLEYTLNPKRLAIYNSLTTFPWTLNYWPKHKWRKQNPIFWPWWTANIPKGQEKVGGQAGWVLNLSWYQSALYKKPSLINSREINPIISARYRIQLSIIILFISLKSLRYLVLENIIGSVSTKDW